MALTEIALFKCQTNDSLVSEDCWFAVQLLRRIWGKSRSHLKFKATKNFLSVYFIHYDFALNPLYEWTAKLERFTRSMEANG